MISNESFDGYYLTESGAALQSKWLRNTNGGWTYYDSDGRCVITGWKKIGNYKYYFSNGSAVLNNTMIDGILYYFNSDGAYLEKSEILSNGWKFIDGNYYYFDKGERVCGQIRVINGRRYAFDGYGRMIIENVYKDDSTGDLYYFDKYGEVASKGWKQNNSIYVGDDGRVVDGLQTIDGKQYYFSYERYNSTYGECIFLIETSDCISSDRKQIYVIDETTHEVKQIINVSGTRWYKTSKGKWFYAKNGVLVKNNYYIINGARYAFDLNGVMCENNNFLLRNTYVEGYANSSGVIISDGWCNDVYFVNGRPAVAARVMDGKYYYLDNYKNSKGIYFVDGNYYRYDAQGNRSIISLKNGWMKVDGNWYYVEKGVLQTSCAKYINGKAYRFDGCGRLITNLWEYTYDSGYSREYRIYRDENGELTKGWKVIDGKTYYFDKNGRTVSGKQTIDGKTYYFDLTGAMI